MFCAIWRKTGSVACDDASLIKCQHFIREQYEDMDALKKEKDKHLGLRIDSELHYKLHYISQYEGRSANGEVIYLIRKAIEEFEKEHGKIERQ